MADVVDPKRGAELVTILEEALSAEHPLLKRRIPPEMLHECLACYGYAQEPLDPEKGTTYFRFDPDDKENPDKYLVIEPHDPVGRRSIKRTLDLVRKVQR